MALNQDMNKIIDLIIHNEEIMKLVVNDVAIAQSLGPIINPEQYIHDRINTYRYDPTIKTEVKTYINIAFGNIKKINRIYRATKIEVYILVHDSLKMITDGSRIFALVDLLDNLLNENKTLGFGLRLESVTELTGLTNYIAYRMIFENIDFKG